ncbi:MAG: EamA family transporter, partial [Chitinophagaceae bacterium]
MIPTNTTPSRFKLFIAFFAVYVIWGITYLAALFGLESMKPFVLSSLRYLTAGCLLSAWILIRKLRWPSGKDIGILSV